MMASMEERLSKLRDERIAREKARIEKLRELNLKKYNKNEPQAKLSAANITKQCTNAVKNHLHVNTAKRPATATSAPAPNKNAPSKDIQNTKSNPVNAIKNNIKPKTDLKTNNKPQPTTSKLVYNKPDLIPSHHVKPMVKPNSSNLNNEKKLPTMNEKSKDNVQVNANATKLPNKQDPKMFRRSIAPVPKMTFQKPSLSRKSLQPPKLTQSVTKSNPNRESVFERLYKPKPVQKKELSDVEKLHTDINHVRKLIKDSGLIVNKRHTVFEAKPKIAMPVRRSISAVHFKRINKSEIPNCIHKWASIGDKLDKVNLQDINEDETVKGNKVISAIKSERKKVKFQTPVPFNLNTPKPEELQSKLKSWLQKRGKSLESYHHLQCFGIHHLASNNLKPIEPPKLELYDDENKENVAVESDSDDGSYVEVINEQEDKNEQADKAKGDFSNDDKYYISMDTWRNASYVSDSGEFNDTRDTSLTSGEVMNVHHVDELLTGALNDLTELLREGFDWEQCARWLRAVRERFPSAPDTAAYWECRAALEERRGDLPASVQCWEEAIAMGTERSVVEANLDQLLDKFMQLKISPNSAKRKTVDPKMVDVKNVFKSTIIRFAVQQAKLRKSSQHEPPKYTVTPVRRSGRLSAHWSAKRTPLRDCVTIRQAGKIVQPLHFVPNDLLAHSP